MASLPISRRTFLADLGHGAVVLAVIGVAACAPGPSTSASTPVAGSTSPSPPPGPSGATGGKVTWTRVNLGFVSAYLLVRGGEAAIVDTGVASSDGPIRDALTSIGLDWGAVGHVILTHKHADHAGSSNAVLTEAAAAVGYAGAADLSAIAAPRPLTPVADGDQVFGLTIVGTPGHTPGSISVLDEVGGLLVAGDALRTDAGKVIGPSPPNSEDMVEANASVMKLGELTFETLLVGHGDPIEAGASAMVAALAP